MTERCGDLVIRVHGGHHYVQTPDGVIDCTIRGRLKQGRNRSDLVVIGDRVCWTPTESGFGIIESVIPRKRVLSRRPPPPRPGALADREQVIIANPDQVLVVFAHRNPEPNPLMLDRYLVACEAVGLPVVIVANKCDLVPDHAGDPFALYRQIGYRVMPTSAATGTGIEALRDTLRGRLSVLTGPSGTGKSSLLNALWPDLQLKTGEISEYHDRGRHTTVVASLFTPEADIQVADTPGLRVFMFWNLPREQLDAQFPEMRPYLERCRYQPCTHVHEPDCAVREAVASGAIPGARYESYLKMFAYGF